MRKGLLISTKGARGIGSGLIWDLIVSVPDHCLSFYFTYHYKYEICLDDIFHCLGEIFAIFVPGLDTSH